MCCVVALFQRDICRWLFRNAKHVVCGWIEVGFPTIWKLFTVYNVGLVSRAHLDFTFSANLIAINGLNKDSPRTKHIYAWVNVCHLSAYLNIFYFEQNTLTKYIYIYLFVYMYIHIYLVIGFLLQSTNPLQIICNFIETKSYNITKLNYFIYKYRDLQTWDSKENSYASSPLGRLQNHQLFACYQVIKGAREGFFF